MSISVVVSVPTVVLAGKFSSRVATLRSIFVGRSLTAFTMMETVSIAVLKALKLSKLLRKYNCLNNIVERKGLISNGVYSIINNLTIVFFRKK